MKLPLRARISIAWNEFKNPSLGDPALLGAQSKSAGGFQTGWPNGGTGRTGTDADLLRAYGNMPWLRSVLGKIGDGIAAAPWFIEAASSNGKMIKVPTWANSSGPARVAMRAKLQRTKCRKSGHIVDIHEIFDHIMLDTLSAPNPMMNGPSLMTLTTLHLDLVGEALWWIKPKNVAGKRVPDQYWPIPPSWVTERPKTTGGVFKISAEGFPKEIPMSDMIWFRLPDPESPYTRTVGVAGPLRDELEADEYAAKHIKAWFLNSCRPDLIVSGTGISDTEIERAEERWMSKLRGYLKAHLPIFLRQDVKVQEVGSKFTDMQLVELRKWQRDVVLQVPGVPPEILGVLESSNRATIDTAAFIFARWVLTPRLELIRATLQTQLVPMYDDRIVVDFSSPVEEDREFALQVRKAFPWAYVLDELRAVTGDPPLENGQGQIVMIPASFVPTKVSELDQFVSPYTARNGREIDQDAAKLLQDLEKAGLKVAS